MLSEGIDIPSLTGVMIINYKELSTLSQIIGRSLRLHSSDRKNIAENFDFKNRIKPYAYILLPIFVKHDDMN